ncbi:MAG: hypothetical protein QXU32_01810 [Nitrososphaerales archaeon]
MDKYLIPLCQGCRLKCRKDRFGDYVCPRCGGTCEEPRYDQYTITKWNIDSIADNIEEY